jgi:hypothetical protein
MLLVLVAPSGAAAGLTKARPLKTGQTTSYGAAGDTTKGVTRSYIDLGNGVIKDQKTGLFWEKKSDDGGIHDKDLLFSWSTGAPYTANGLAFTVLLAALNTQKFGGFSDWRLPTITELQTLVDFARNQPSVDVKFNTGCVAGCSVLTCSCTLSAGYWSSTTVEYYPTFAWDLFFDFGAPDVADKTQVAYVRSVRGGTP